jgi:3-methylfumaryl-CoA hydratase
MSSLTDWIGQSESQADVIAAWPLRALAATLDFSAPSDVVPPLWHWLYFLPTHAHSELGPDGHAQRGSFLPPVALPRRMWAGSRFVFRDALRIGDQATRTSTIRAITEKQGRSGPLVFITVEHVYKTARGIAIIEEHDIVFRDHERPVQPPGQPQERRDEPVTMQSDVSREVAPTDVLLFRYSALTFNGHRIHYDRRYCTDVEGYPGLVVHGPLIATLLLELACSHWTGRRVEAFSFRALRPIFDTTNFTLHGRSEGHTVELWATSPDGLSMTADARFAA